MSHTHFTIACEGCGTRIGGCRCMEGGGDLRREGYCPDCKAKRAPGEAVQYTPPVPLVSPAPGFDFHTHLARQAAWSEKTFGPGTRAKGVVDHIRKELKEIEADPGDLKEWIDVVILALDGAWRSGASPDQIIAALAAKQAKNEARDWPDWRTMDPDKAIEHDRSKDAPAPQPIPPEAGT